MIKLVVASYRRQQYLSTSYAYVRPENLQGWLDHYADTSPTGVTFKVISATPC